MRSGCQAGTSLYLDKIPTRLIKVGLNEPAVFLIRILKSAVHPVIVRQDENDQPGPVVG